MEKCGSNGKMVMAGKNSGTKYSRNTNNEREIFKGKKSA